MLRIECVSQFGRLYVFYSPLLSKNALTRRSKRMNAQPQTTTKDSSEIERRHWMRNARRPAFRWRRNKKKRKRKNTRERERKRRPCWIAIFGDEKRRDRGREGDSPGENRFEEDHVKSDSSREGSTCGHVRAERARLVPATVEKENQAARVPPLRDPSSLPLLLVRNRGGQRGIHSCTHSQNATRVRMCPIHVWGSGGGPRGRTWRRGKDEYFHHVDLQDEKIIESKKWWNGGIQ